MKSPLDTRRSLLMPFAIAVVIAAASLFFFTANRNYQAERLALETRNVGSVFAARLETHLSSRLSAGELLGRRFLLDDRLDFDMFRLETSLLHELFGDFQALNWVDTNGVIQIVTPEEGNAAALGLNLRTIPQADAALSRAEETGRMQITPPLTLAQGGTGFVAYVPIVTDSKPRGYLTMVFRAEPLMVNALGEKAPLSYNFLVLDGDSVLFSSGERFGPDTVLEERAISVGNREWKLQAAPTSARIAQSSTALDEVILGVGVLFAIVTGLLSHLALARQRSLQYSQASFQDFASASSDWLWELDEDLRFTWCSQSTEEFLGVPRETMLGKRRGDFRDSDGGDDDWTAHFADLKARRPFRDFVSSKVVRGKKKWLRTSGVPFFDARGNFLGYRGTVTDTTELVQTRDAAQSANERLAAAVEGLSDVFSLWDSEDRLVFGNKVFRDLNKNIPHVLVPGTPFEKYLRAGVKTGHMRDLEGKEEAFVAEGLARRHDPTAPAFEVERADGVILRLREQKLEGGGNVTIGQDVTKERLNAEALRASEERLALAVQQLSIWDWDITEDTLYMSPGFAKALGYSHDEFEEIKRGSMASIVHPDDVDEYLTKLHAHLEDPTTLFSNEHRFRTRSGDYRSFLAIGQSRTDDAGNAVRFAGALTDITERVELENQLQQAQKMEAIGNLTGGVAHDFNNLLAVILGNLELIKEAERSGDIEEYIDASIQATQRGADLVKKMLSFSRQSRLEPEIFNFNTLIDEARMWFLRVLPENIHFEILLADDLQMVEADPTLAQSALLNLILNARDAMPNGGKLTVETSNMRIEDTLVDSEGEVFAKGDYVMLSIRDTGEGIPKEILNNVFQPFFTTKPTGAGSGLGLSMVQGFMKQSGGMLRVSSEPGSGAHFKLIFRTARIEAHQDLEEDVQEEQDVSPSARVFLVEDEPAVLRVLTRTLSKAGYDVQSAVSGDEALAAWGDDQDYDLLITDIVMPGALQGVQLARTLREKYPSLPVIFLSGYSATPRDGHNGRHPQDIRLMKPVQRADLVNAVERALSARSEAGAQAPLN